MQKFHAPFLFLLAIIIVAIVSVTTDQTLAPVHSITILLGTLLIIAGIALGWRAKNLFKKHGTTLDPLGTPSALITASPFNFTRNPMYLSYVMVAVGFATFSRALTALFLTVLYFFYLDYRVIRKEERKLENLFEAQYADYSKKVRRWI